MIPNLATHEILTSWDTTGRYTTDKRKNAITLRFLLAHSSGAGYDKSNPGLAMVTKSQGREINVGATVNERFDYPLLFEPGTGWMYGTGMDWVGQLVECLTGQDMESYMQEYIWSPLEIQKITFWPSRHIDINAECMQMTVRDATSRHVVSLQKPFLAEGVSECFGGQGAYAAMKDFLKILRSILADDGKLLAKETTAMIFQPQLGGWRVCGITKESNTKYWLLQSRVQELENDLFLLRLAYNDSPTDYLKESLNQYGIIPDQPEENSGSNTPSLG